jgi:hypothetical protein
MPIKISKASIERMTVAVPVTGITFGSWEMRGLVSLIMRQRSNRIYVRWARESGYDNTIEVEASAVSSDTSPAQLVKFTEDHVRECVNQWEKFVTEFPSSMPVRDAVLVKTRGEDYGSTNVSVVSKEFLSSAPYTFKRRSADGNGTTYVSVSHLLAEETDTYENALGQAAKHWIDQI